MKKPVRNKFKYKRTRLYRTLKGNRNWFDIARVRYIGTFLEANQIKRNQKPFDIAGIRYIPYVERLLCIKYLQYMLRVYNTVWEILTKTVNDLLTPSFQSLRLIGQTGFRRSKVSLRSNSNPVFELGTNLGFTKLNTG